MAIGTSITPRGYNIDVTGKDFTLDPRPLLEAQHRAFETQNETMQMVRATAKAGVDFAEFLGARQQLGRVKAQVSELDVNDPAFAQKYSQIVFDNPLAFTNEKVAPLTKVALTPMISAAAKVQEEKAALQRAQVMAGFQRDLAGVRTQGQMDVIRYRNENPPAPRPSTKTPSAAERLLFGSDITDGGAGAPASTGDSTATDTGAGGSMSVPELPTPADGTPLNTPSLIPFSPDGDGVDSENQQEDLIEGQGDGPQRIPPAISKGNGVFSTQGGLGDFRIDSVAKDIKLTPVVKATKPEAPEGYISLPSKFNEDGTVAEFKVEPKIVRSAAEQSAMDNDVQRMVLSNPKVTAWNTAVAAAKAEAKSLQDQAELLVKADAKDKAAELAPRAAEAAQVAAGLEDQVKKQTAELADQYYQVVDPKYYAQKKKIAELEKADADAQKEAKDNAKVYPSREELLRQYDPLTDEAAPASPDASAYDQLHSSGSNPAKDKAWTEEKSFAVEESKRVSKELGLTPNAIIDAVAKGDKASLNAVLFAISQKGVKTPLVKPIQPMPGLMKTSSVPTWNKSKAPTGFGNASYIDVLRAAVKELPSTVSGSGKANVGWKYKAK